MNRLNAIVDSCVFALDFAIDVLPFYDHHLETEPLDDYRSLRDAIRRQRNVCPDPPSDRPVHRARWFCPRCRRIWRLGDIACHECLPACPVCGCGTFGP